MRVNAPRVLPALLMLILCACAQQPSKTSSSAAAASTSAHKQHARIDYSRYVKHAVGSFSFSSLYDWDSNDPSHVVVWVSPIEAYRLNLLGACLGLQSSMTLLLTSHGGQVSAGFDSISVQGDHCGIQSIDKLDAKAIREARKAAKSGD